MNDYKKLYENGTMALMRSSQTHNYVPQWNGIKSTAITKPEWGACYSEAAVRYFPIYLFLKIFEYSQENTCVRLSF